MNQLSQSATPVSFIVDPNRDGVANALWKAITGSLALSGATPDQFLFNTVDAVVRTDLLYGSFIFGVVFPTTGVQTPTNLADDVAFGLKNASMGDFGKIDVFIDKSEDTIEFRTHDEFGTEESTTLTWNTAWNNALTLFRITWSRGKVALEVLVNGETSWTELASHTTRTVDQPLNLFFNTVGADNVDVNFIAVKNALRTSTMLI